MDASALDAAMAAFIVYQVGTRFDGMPVLSLADGIPDDDTEVWFPDDPETKMTVMDVDNGTDVSWAAEPVEYTPPAVAAALPPTPEDDEDDEDPLDPEMGDELPVDDELDDEMALDDLPVVEEPTDDEMAEGEPLDDADEPLDIDEEPEAPPAAPTPPPPTFSEAELDEIGQAVDMAETRVAQLEGLVASVLLSEVTDAIFEDEPRAAAAEAPVSKEAFTRLRELFSTSETFQARVARLGDTADLPPDMVDRVEKVMGRLTALEESISKVMLDDVTDEEMPSIPEGSSSFVDETNPNRPGKKDDAAVAAAEDDDEDDGDANPFAAKSADDPESDDEDDEGDDTPDFLKKKKRKA